MRGRAYLPYRLLSTALKPGVGRGAAHEKDQRRRPMLPFRHRAPSKQYEGRTRRHYARHPRPSPERRGRPSLHPRSTTASREGMQRPTPEGPYWRPTRPGHPPRTRKHHVPDQDEAPTNQAYQAPDEARSGRSRPLNVLYFIYFLFQLPCPPREPCIRPCRL